MDLFTDLPESCTAEEAERVIAIKAKGLAIVGDPPSLRTLRLWRSKRFLSKSGHRFTRRNILEALYIIRMASGGVPTGAAAERCAELDDGQLLWALTEREVVVRLDSSRGSQVTLELLANGIINQYRTVMKGEIVGHSDTGRLGGYDVPLSLQQASARIGRLYMEEGREDIAASIHALLAYCATPLIEWAPRAIVGIPDAADVVLIDPEYRMPSEDCTVIAQQAPGAHLEDALENDLHNELMKTLSKLGTDADYSYTFIREFIARHPLARVQDLRRMDTTGEVPDEAIRFVRSLYDPVHAYFAQDDKVRICLHCRAIIRPDGCCSVQGCREDHPETRHAGIIPLAEALAVKTIALKYWVDPAREELRLYDALHKAGIDVTLYPHSDRCDVSIGEEVGVDVKDYRSPVQLARKLNVGIGGLVHYPRRILAVADRRARSEDYVNRLCEQLLPEHRRRLEVYSVGAAISTLTREYRHKGG